MSLTSSSGYSITTGPQQLHRLVFKGDTTAHWALFLQDRVGNPTGLAVHIGV